MADYTISALDSRLKNYLETNGVEVLTKALFNSESAKYFQVQTGVTAEQPIIRLDSSITLADASECGFSATGSDTFTNRLLSPKFLKVNKEFCPKTLLKTWAHSDVKMAATGQELPFEELLINNNINDRISVDDVVALVPMSRRLLESTFRKEMDTSIYQYIIKVRVEKMKDLMINGYSPEFQETDGYDSRRIL